MAFAALTLGSHAALADVTNPGNPDSVDFSAQVKAETNRCAITVTPTDTDFSFIYQYTSTDVANSTAGTMTPGDGANAQIKVSAPVSCQLAGHVAVQFYYQTQNTVQLSNSIPGILTHNGGAFPAAFGLSDITFYSDPEATSDPRKAKNRSLDLPVSSAPEAAGDGHVTFVGDGGYNPWPTTRPTLTGTTLTGHMRYNGAVNGSYIDGRVWVSSGLQLGTSAGNAQRGRVNTPDATSTSTYYPLDQAASEIDDGYVAASIVYNVVSLVSPAPYSIATKSVDPSTVYDTNGGASPVTATVIAQIDTL